MSDMDNKQEDKNPEHLDGPVSWHPVPRARVYVVVDATTRDPLVVCRNLEDAANAMRDLALADHCMNLARGLRILTSEWLGPLPKQGT